MIDKQNIKLYYTEYNLNILSNILVLDNKNQRRKIMFKTKFKILTLIIVFLLAFSITCNATSETTPDSTAEVEAISSDDVSQEPVEQETDVVTTSEEADNQTATSEETEDDIGSIQASEDINSQLHNGDYYVSGDDVTIDKLIDGNAFVMANKVTITGEIGGDLFVMAKEVDINEGYVYGNVFVVADSFNLTGTIYDLYAYCGNITIGYDGIVYRDLKATAGNIDIQGRIGRNVFTSSNNLKISEDVLIYGNLEYSAKDEVEVPEGIVSGEIKYTKSNDILAGRTIGELVLSYVTSLVGTLALVLIVWLLINKLTPNFAARLNNLKPISIFKALGIGLLVIVVVPLIILLLMFTIVGLPIAMVLSIIYMLLYSLSFAFAVLAIVGMLTKKPLSKGKSILFVILTAIILWLLINILGIINMTVELVVSIIIFIFGIGALLINMFSKKSSKSETSTIEK